MALGTDESVLFVEVSSIQVCPDREVPLNMYTSEIPQNRDWAYFPQDVPTCHGCRTLEPAELSVLSVAPVHPIHTALPNIIVTVCYYF